MILILFMCNLKYNPFLFTEFVAKWIKNNWNVILLLKAQFGMGFKFGNISMS